MLKKVNAKEVNAKESKENKFLINVKLLEKQRKIVHSFHSRSDIQFNVKKGLYKIKCKIARVEKKIFKKKCCQINKVHIYFLAKI